MGCATSKLDDSPALAVCRERCAFLDAALRQRFTLAQAHVAYLNSLKAVGLSIDRFFNQDSDAFAHGPPSPVLNLPARRKGDPSPSEPPASPPEKIQHHLPSHSDSDSHLHFLSDDDDGSGSDSLHHLDFSSPVYQHHFPYGGYFSDYENPGAGGGGFMNISYMKKQATPSVVYNQRPISPETVQMGESSSYYPYPIYSNGNYQQNPNPPYPIHNPNNNYNGYFNYSIYGGGGGAFGGSSLPQATYGGGFSSPSAAASSSKAPPPPPSPPSSSAWDFLNPFESYEKIYPPYAPSRDSRELREEEGIPDLEDEDDEVVKEVHGNQKFIDSGRSSYSKSGSSDEDAPVMNDAELQYRAGPSVGTESGPVEYEVQMVDKKVVGAKEKSKYGGNAAAFRPRRGFSGDSEVVREIKVQFERASDSGNELTKFLEFGRRPYKRKHGGRHVSTKILHLPSVSSLSSTSKRSDGDDPASLEIHQELELRSKTLSSTLHKLDLWEKKLCEEVKVEEKMRILHEQKSTKLKQLDERGAEAHKLDAARALVRSLSTKIRIAIQVVDKISVKINSLRDEELWPQLNEFIQGLTRMWKSVLECHHNQCQAIGEAKRLDAVAFQKYFSDARFEATRQLEYDLINWTQSFSDWIGAQKSYVQALNNWLTKCLLYVPEETPDGVVPFSPGRIGAPPVFVVCNQWCQSLDRVSEREVVDSMLDFTSDVLQLWNRDKAEMRQRMLASKDERKIKSLDKEDQKMQKEFQALHKRMVLIFAGDVMPLARHVQSETTKGGNLQASLQHVLEAMERFAAVSLKVYEDLLQRIEEDHLAGEQENVL